MKLTTPQIKSLAAGLPVQKYRYPEKAPWFPNHEVWRRCNQCGEVFDLRKILDCKYPKCDSEDITV